MALMGERLARFLLARSVRERWLLALCGGAALPLAIVFGVLIPLEEARKAAADEVAQARTTTQWVVGQVVDARVLGLQRLPPGQELETGVEPIGSSGLEETLIDAGLRPAVEELGRNESGVVTIRFDAVRFIHLAAWMTTSDPGWGYDVTRLEITKTELSGLVTAALTLSPSGQIDALE